VKKRAGETHLRLLVCKQGFEFQIFVLVYEHILLQRNFGASICVFVRSKSLYLHIRMSCRFSMMRFALKVSDLKSFCALSSSTSAYR